MKGDKIFKCLIAAVIAASTLILCFACGCESTYDWVLKTIKKEYYEELPENYEFDGDVKKFVSTYLDRYSAYYTRSEYLALTASNEGSKSGVGISFIYVGEGEHPSGESGILLESVIGNSPAALSGLKSGEFIKSAVSADGSQTVFNSTDDFVNYLDGKNTGEKFTFVTDRGMHELSKEDYTASYCSMSTASADYTITYKDSVGSVVKDEEGGMPFLPLDAAYVRINQFYGKASTELGMLVEEFNAQACTSLILDLRGNGGGYVDLMSEISDIFVGSLPEHYPVSMKAVYKSGKTENFMVEEKFSQNRRLSAGVKVSVLADNGTASASEALIGVLVDNGVIDYGDIYLSDFSREYLDFSGMADKNCRTYGKGIMQTTFTRMFTGEALKLTTAKIYWPKGETCIHDVGLTVEAGCKTVPAVWDVTYGDEQLKMAVGMIYPSSN